MWFVQAHLMFWGLPLILLAYASAVDLKYRRVSDAVPLAILCWAVFGTWMDWSGMTWMSLVLGLMLGLGIGLLMHALAFGGGDLTLLAALGACAGVLGVPMLCFWILATGFLFGLVARFRAQKTLAYVPAIAIGTLAFVATGGQQ